MSSDLLLAAVAGLVGLLIGTVGVGGVLMVAFLALFGGLTIHEAAGTALFTFAFTGLLGTWLYQRRGTINWRVAGPVCAGAMLFGYAGAVAAGRMDPRPLTILIALIIIFAGTYVFLPQRAVPRARAGHGWREQLLLTTVGAGSGFGSGFSGAGGPLFSVPLMLILRYVPLTAVATSQALQIVAATSGSIANYRLDYIDFRVATIITVFELIGVMAGVKLAHAASATALRRLAAAFCIVSGGFLLARAL